MKKWLFPIPIIIFITFYYFYSTRITEKEIIENYERNKKTFWDLYDFAKDKMHFNLFIDEKNLIRINIFNNEYENIYNGIHIAPSNKELIFNLNKIGWSRIEFNQLLRHLNYIDCTTFSGTMDNRIFLGYKKSKYCYLFLPKNYNKKKIECFYRGGPLHMIDNRVGWFIELPGPMGY